MERVEAEGILDGDRETAVLLLLRVGELVEANQRLEARVGELERRLKSASVVNIDETGWKTAAARTMRALRRPGRRP